MFNEYWADLLQLAVATGMPTPQDVPTFLLAGWLGKDAKGNERVISNDHAGIFFIGWRCLYAEIVRSRVDAVRIDLEKALKRAVAMIIGRIKAEQHAFLVLFLHARQRQREKTERKTKYE